VFANESGAVLGLTAFIRKGLEQNRSKHQNNTEDSKEVKEKQLNGEDSAKTEHSYPKMLM
jgi:hypothetical protein